MQRFDEDSLESLAEEIAGWMEEANGPARSLGKPCEAISSCHRGLAILRLLVHADAQGFFRDLAQSAQARRHYLTRCAAESIHDFHASTSRADPYFDALAAGCFDLAADLALLSPSTFRAGDEYEDDFCYVRFLSRRLDGASPDDLTAILRRFEEVLDGAPSARLAICKALLAQDGAAFHAAFDDLLLERDAEIARERKAIAEESIAAAAGTFVFIEGLALLRLADRTGFDVRGRDYPLCPRLARGTMRRGLPPDALALGG